MIAKFIQLLVVAGLLTCVACGTTRDELESGGDASSGGDSWAGDSDTAQQECPAKVYQGNVNASLPAQVDELSGYTAVDGYVHITGSEISDLDSLACLKEVSDGFAVSFCDGLTDIEGLAQLTTVGGDFGFYHVYEITSLYGLRHLKNVGGDLDISFNSKLPQCEVDLLVARLVANGFDGNTDAIMLNEGSGTCSSSGE